MLSPAEWSGIGAIVLTLSGLVLGWVKGKQDGRKLAQEMLIAALDRANVEIDRLLDRVQSLEDGRVDQTLMMTHLDSVHSWIERGGRPPDPVRPSWLTPGPFSPLGRARERETDDRN